MLGASGLCAGLAAASVPTEMETEAGRKRSRALFEEAASSGAGVPAPTSSEFSPGPEPKRRCLSGDEGGDASAQDLREDVSLFEALPDEMQLYIFSKTHEPETHVNLRLVSQRTNALMDDVPLRVNILNMGRLRRALQENPHLKNSKKFVIHGWTNDVAKALADIPPALTLKSCHLYTSSVVSLPSELPPHTLITLTTLTRESARTKVPLVLGTNPIRDHLVVQSREELWEAFVGSAFARQYDPEEKILKAHDYLGCFLEQEEGAARLAYLLTHYEKKKLRYLAPLFRKMTEGDKRQIVSFLTVDFMSFYLKEGRICHKDFTSAIKKLLSEKDTKERDELGAYFQRVIHQSRRTNPSLTHDVMQSLVRIKHLRLRGCVAALLTPYTANDHMIELYKYVNDEKFCQIIARQLSAEFFDTVAGEDFLGLSTENMNFIYLMVRHITENINYHNLRQREENFFASMAPVMKSLFQAYRTNSFQKMLPDTLESLLKKVMKGLFSIVHPQTRKEIAEFLATSSIEDLTQKSALPEIITLLSQMPRPEVRGEVFAYLTHEFLGQVTGCNDLRVLSPAERAYIFSILTCFMEEVVKIPAREERAHMVRCLTPVVKMILRQPLSSASLTFSDAPTKNRIMVQLISLLGNVADKSVREELAKYCIGSFDYLYRDHPQKLFCVLRRFPFLTPEQRFFVATHLERCPRALQEARDEPEIINLLDALLLLFEKNRTTRADKRVVEYMNLIYNTHNGEKQIGA